jgi:DNA polymerase-1
MSVSRPALTGLPSSSWEVRRSVLADPGQLIVSADFEQIDLRVLAVLADAKGMRQAIAGGVDLHGFSAGLMFGEGFTPRHRKLAKAAGLGRVFGGGAKVIAKQTGSTLEQATRVTSAYDEAFPEVAQFGRRLRAEAAAGGGVLITRSGRRMPLDPGFEYRATNYAVQSTAADAFKVSLLKADAAGLTPHLLLPIHDELLAQAPHGEAAALAHTLAEVMTRNFDGVRLSAAGEVSGPSWGSGYGIPAGLDAPGPLRV